MRDKLGAAALLGALIIIGLVDPVTPQEIPISPQCRGWISVSCCCSNGACREVQPGEVEQIGENLYLIVPTGEKIPRTGWSKDGTFIRCAYKRGSYGHGLGGGWLVGPQYETSCLFPPAPSS